MVCDEIKEAIVFRLKQLGNEDKPKKEIMEAYEAKVEEVVTKLERSIYAESLKEEIKEFKAELFQKGKNRSFYREDDFPYSSYYYDLLRVYHYRHK